MSGTGRQAVRVTKPDYARRGRVRFLGPAVWPAALSRRGLRYSRDAPPTPTTGSAAPNPSRRGQTRVSQPVRCLND